MSRISHEDFLRQIFEAKAQLKTRQMEKLANLPPEKKLEMWLRWQQIEREILEEFYGDDKTDTK